ncbi:MAG: hypothetical protein WAV38_08625, partial [Xanthobacteraceae bacterium]
FCYGGMVKQPFAIHPAQLEWRPIRFVERKLAISRSLHDDAHGLAYRNFVSVVRADDQRMQVS